MHHHTPQLKQRDARDLHGALCQSSISIEIAASSLSLLIPSTKSTSEISQIDPILASLHISGEVMK